MVIYDHLHKYVEVTGNNQNKSTHKLFSSFLLYRRSALWVFYRNDLSSVNILSPFVLLFILGNHFMPPGCRLLTSYFDR